MRRLKKVLILCTLPIMLIMGGCSLKNLSYDKDKVTALELESLYEYKDSYVGDNSAVINILSMLPFSDKGMTFELQTKKEPYGIIVNYNFDENIDEKTLEKNAVVIFTLIKNVENITFKFKNMNNDTYKFTRDEILQKYSMELEDLESIVEELQK